jgi:D-arabinose 1-dehydrogenase-like Zn-dependent alcohol dehydrogenase
MKAAVVVEPGRLEVRELPQPAVGPYDALCEMLWGATCTGTDGHLVHGRFPWPVRYPTVIGHESVGRVVQVGAEVRRLRAGDVVSRVGLPAAADGSFDVNWGGFSELGVARDWMAMRDDGLPEAQWRGHSINQVIPPDIDPASATMVVTWRETLSTITRMGLGRGASALVIGSGGNGLAFAVHARHMGAESVGMVGSAGRLETCRAAGADLALAYSAPDTHDRLRDARPGGFDFVIDAVGKSGVADAYLPHVAAGGMVTVYGVDDFGKCLLNPTRARGTFTLYQGGYEEAEAHHRVIDLMRSGDLDASVWLNLAHPYPLAEIGRAFDDLAARKHVKALIRLGA